MRPCVSNEAQTSLGLSKGFKPFCMCSRLCFSNRVLDKGSRACSYHLFLDQTAKFSLQDPLEVDKFISAEIPPNSTPEPRNTDIRHMI